MELIGKLVAAFQAQGGPPAAPVRAVDSDAEAAAIACEPEAAPPGGASPLSPREEDVLREIARGASNKEIARALDIAETTVKIHVQHILRKLGLSSRVQAAVYASERQRE
ncbi:response regulator transcription factor [Paracidovorax avenae]|uniref:response regulator transcription factor n=1 Tax=Paracidovorax avenae TaxID=80867 RepID=UPI0039C97CBB